MSLVDMPRTDEDSLPPCWWPSQIQATRLNWSIHGLVGVGKSQKRLGEKTCTSTHFPWINHSICTDHWFDQITEDEKGTCWRRRTISTASTPRRSYLTLLHLWLCTYCSIANAAMFSKRVPSFPNPASDNVIFWSLFNFSHDLSLLIMMCAFPNKYPFHRKNSSIFHIQHWFFT